MSPRLAAHIFVGAVMRRAEGEGAMVAVVRRGEAESGAVILKLVETVHPFSAPRCRVLARATLADGRSGWSWLVGPELAFEAEADAKLARAADVDPDLWIVEIADRAGRAFVDDPIM